MPDDSALYRAALRDLTRRWTATQRRLLVERVLEHLPDAELERLLAVSSGWTRSIPRLSRSPSRPASPPTPPRPGAASTSAWVAATSHLFDLALERQDEEALRELVALVEEVDERIDEMVVFEDSTAGLELGHQVEATRGIIGAP